MKIFNHYCIISIVLCTALERTITTASQDNENQPPASDSDDGIQPPGNDPSDGSQPPASETADGSQPPGNEPSDGNQPPANGDEDPGDGKPKPTLAPRMDADGYVHPYIRRPFKEQQSALVEAITRLNLDPSNNQKEPSAALFKILKKCTEIFQKNVDNELVLHKIIDNALVGFRILFEGLDTNTLPPEIFADIMETLTKCDGDGRHLQFHTSSCPLEIERVMVEDNGTTTAHIPKIPFSRQFDEWQHDLIIEVNWKMFDFCHSRCFEHFRPQFNSHHYMGYEMEEFFLKFDIRERWYRTTRGLSYLKGIISASKLMVRMKNLDLSVAGAHMNSKYRVWLEKPGVHKFRISDSD